MDSGIPEHIFIEYSGIPEPIFIEDGTPTVSIQSPNLPSSNVGGGGGGGVRCLDEPPLAGNSLCTTMPLVYKNRN